MDPTDPDLDPQHSFKEDEKNGKILCFEGLKIQRRRTDIIRRLFKLILNIFTTPEFSLEREQNADMTLGYNPGSESAGINTWIWNTVVPHCKRVIFDLVISYWPVCYYKTR